MPTSELVQRVEELDDLELALLLGVLAHEHCLIETEDEALDSLQQELQLIVSNLTSRTHVVIGCNPDTTLDEFINGLLLEADPVKGSAATNDVDTTDLIELFSSLRVKSTAGLAALIDSGYLIFSSNIRQILFGPLAQNCDGRLIFVTLSGPCARRPVRELVYLAPGFDENVADVTRPSDIPSQEPRIADVVILKNLNLASYDIQIQALELIRTKRMFTHTTVVTAPKTFCMVVIQPTASARLNKHLNDHIFLSHYHDLEDGFPNLENASDWIEDDRSSTSSIVRKSALSKPKQGPGITLSELDIQHLTQAARTVTVTAEVECYLQNIVAFLRMHRAVDGGMNPRATKYFKTLATCLAPLHGLDYVTPSLVAIAARKIYPHRIILTTAERDRSLQYGSDLAAVRAALEGMTPESVIEDVLAAVETPL
ncbi:MAG: hypothetical protein L6R40_003424 [Gallowayella cf. fulva]|nr:MAG: hypothetical protein L6R40_003424 [Xanthomendoza cf. fulva]